MLIGLLVLHLALHWKWIVCMVKGRSKARWQARSRVTVALAGLVALLVLAVSPVLSSKEQAMAPERGRAAVQEERFTRRGAPVAAEENLTLGAIAYATGVPVACLVATLGLPNHVSTDESLRSLRQTHHVAIEDVRRVVRAYRPAS